eukprot:TRINITY_DN1174_c0_g3_i1.p1 TRINITY_DN1174_c0_g3~~TRINITY_DN1174_c0_g3_i1.p1  ORF type:complete len:100 (-),score=4.23 TRINITY_DN1174_c0_g3_i1:29-328(-)
MQQSPLHRCHLLRMMRCTNPDALPLCNYYHFSEATYNPGFIRPFYGGNGCYIHCTSRGSPKKATIYMQTIVLQVLLGFIIFHRCFTLNLTLSQSFSIDY